MLFPKWYLIVLKGRVELKLSSSFIETIHIPHSSPLSVQFTDVCDHQHGQFKTILSPLAAPPQLTLPAALSRQSTFLSTDCTALGGSQ